MYGLPEQGKAAKVTDALLDALMRSRDEIVAECGRQAPLEWALIYTTTMADLMVNAPEADRVRFAAEIRDVVIELDLLPEPSRYIARPADLELPPAEGEWLIDGENIHVGED